MTIPFVKGKVPVVVDIESHTAIQAIAQWGPELKRKIEEACLKHYRDKVDSIGPETLPRIRSPREVWRHLKIQHVRIDPTVKDRVVVYVLPDWDEEEQMALTLGASGLRMFFRVSLPKIKWGLVYGLVLCNARAMGEFGAVSVVSGHIRGLTNTLPLHVEILYNEYQFTAAFAVASLLTLLALVTLLLKTVIEWRSVH